MVYREIRPIIPIDNEEMVNVEIGTRSEGVNVFSK